MAHQENFLLGGGFPLDGAAYQNVIFKQKKKHYLVIN